MIRIHSQTVGNEHQKLLHYDYLNSATAQIEYFLWLPVFSPILEYFVSSHGTTAQITDAGVNQPLELDFSTRFH